MSLTFIQKKFAIEKFVQIAENMRNMYDNFPESVFRAYANNLCTLLTENRAHNGDMNRLKDAFRESSSDFMTYIDGIFMAISTDENIAIFYERICCK
jgi:hypothetical protein